MNYFENKKKKHRNLFHKVYRWTELHIEIHSKLIDLLSMGEIVDIHKKPTISVIVPVYNEEKYLKRCLDSIINQEYRKLEIILVDDGSTDSSGFLCDEFSKLDNRIHVIHRKNAGASAARNTGIETSNGEYLSFVDSDDWIELDMYSYLMKNAIEYQADIVSGSFVLTDGDVEDNRKIPTLKSFEGDDKLIMYLESGMKSRLSEYSPCNKLYKRALFNDIRFPVGQIYEDVVTNLRLIDIANKFIQSNKIIYNYYQGGFSTTRGKFSGKDFDLLLVGKQTVQYLESKNNKKLLNLAQMKEARSYFTLLTKISIYGFNDSVSNPNDIIVDLSRNLRSNYWYLMRSKMQVNRKALMTLLCIDYRIVNWLAKMYFRLKNAG